MKTAARPDSERIGSYARCMVCGHDKCPRGRSAPMGYLLCDYECPGYNKPPLPGDLWPGESAEDFGYPCQTTEERQLPLSDWDGWYTDDAEEHAPVESERDWEEGEDAYGGSQ